MKDKENRDCTAPFASAISSDKLDDVFLYENALKNLRRELEEKQNLIAQLQNETVRRFSDADLTFAGGGSDFVYGKNRDMAQRIKDYAAEMLIGELKSISSSMRRKLNEINEKESRLATRLIEIEERQAILEEIDYVQRMIPKKMLQEKMQQSVEIKKEAETDPEEIFRPAVHKILEKEQEVKAKIAYREKEEPVLAKQEVADIAPVDEDKLQEAVQEMPQEEQAPEVAERIAATVEKTDGDSATIVTETESRPYASEDALPSFEEEEVFGLYDEGDQVYQRGEEEKIPERKEEHFAYIRDSKIKLKPEDMLSIQKAIRGIEQGRFAVQGD